MAAPTVAGMATSISATAVATPYTALASTASVTTSAATILGIGAGTTGYRVWDQNNGSR
ncbi:hypothetical protein IRZ77_20350 [Pseudomonas pudica]|uniref:Uncharacterized protein n=1 Tax=Pseudomonas pudica TaxID=272772 RepID=A0ABS0G5M0_9PSED|nr:hypothetical protein [Pseudomonas pudica]